MRSVIDLERVATDLLASYCSPASCYAWPHYDRDPNPDELTGVDVLAPALLSYPIKSGYLEQLLRQQATQDSYQGLMHAMRHVVADDDCTRLKFEDLDRAALSDRSTPGWGSVIEAMQAAQHCPGLTSVAVSKILHRKRPDLVPIVDSRLRSFYGVTGQGYDKLFERIHDDINEHRDALDAWRKPYRVGEHQPMSRLRALDIVIWMSFEPSTGP